jgi:hypothetical protein
MASVAGVTKKLSQELMDGLVDKIASLKAAGKVEEAIAEEAKLARLQKNIGREAENVSLDESIDPVKIKEATTNWDSNEFQRPNTEIPPSIDTQITPPKGMFDAEPLIPPMPKKSSALGVGAAGTAAALALTGDEWHVPLALPTTNSDTKPPEGEKKKEAPITPMQASGSGAGVSEQPHFDTPKIANKLAGWMGDLPKEEDFTQWDTKLEGITGRRETLSNQLKSDVLEATAAANVASSSIEKRELMETITNAIGQIATGMYGMETGLDLSGAQFHKTDWNAKLDRIRANLKDNVERLTASQQIDQNIISDEKDTLLRNKDDLAKKFERSLHVFTAKNDMRGKEQMLEVEKSKLELDTNKINAEIGIKAKEAIMKAAKENKPPKEQISAGMKVHEENLNKLLNEHGKLAIQYGSDKTSSDQKAAIAGQMETIDRKVKSLRGTPIVPSPTNPLETASYEDMNIKDVLLQKANAEKSLKEQMNGFKAPSLQGVKKSFLDQRELIIANDAQKLVEQGKPVEMAFKTASDNFGLKLQGFFNIEKAYQDKLRNANGGK